MTDLARPPHKLWCLMSMARFIYVALKTLRLLRAGQLLSLCRPIASNK